MSKHCLSAGFTLIELMVSLAIGALVTSSGLVVYSQISAARNLIQAELRLQDGIYFAHQTWRQYVNQAGYRPLSSETNVLPLFPVDSMEETFPEVAGTWESGEYVRVLDDGIAIRFEGSSDDTDTADGSLQNCQGEAIAEGETVVLEFTLEAGSLNCTSDGVTTELIGSRDFVQVEQIAVSWGVDTDNDLNVDLYREASSAMVSTDSIKAMRVRLLLSSLDEVQSVASDYIFDDTQYTATDRRIRREYVNTLQLKN